LEPTSLRTTEFAAAISPSEPTATCPASSVPSCGYGPPTTATSWKAGRFTGADFPLQPDGTLRCPAGQVLTAHEQRREVDGSLRVVYGASIRSCRPCPLREQCQWQGSATKKPRQVSMLLHPLTVGPAPLRLSRLESQTSSTCVHARGSRSQRVEVQEESGSSACPPLLPVSLSRAERAHSRLSWQERFARNVRPQTANQVTIHLFGVPKDFAASLGLAIT